MRMNFGNAFEIEDLGKHSPSTAIGLAMLLARPVEAVPDPKRPRFYEILGQRTVYYVYLSPFRATIFLLACWKRWMSPEPQLAHALAARP